LKYGIDTWLAANIAPISDTSTVPAHPSNTIPFQCDAPPHIALHFEAIRSEVHMAKITNTTDSADPPSGNSTDDAASELYNLHEVLAMEQRKCDARLPKPQNPPPSQPAPPITTSAPIPSTQPATNTTCPAPQYCYQSNAEDQQLTTQLFNWLLEGKLTNATLAHILAASTPI